MAIVRVGREVVEPTGDRAGERSGVRGVLRLRPGNPHDPVVEYEYAEPHQYEESDADLDKDGTLLRTTDALYS